MRVVFQSSESKKYHLANICQYRYFSSRISIKNENIQNNKKECRFQVSHWSAVLCRTYAQFSYAWPCMCVLRAFSVGEQRDWYLWGFLLLFEEISKITAFYKRHTRLTMKTSHPKMPSHQTRKLRSRDRENMAYLKTVLHWKKDNYWSWVQVI